jgi:hypothetical protein
MGIRTGARVGWFSAIRQLSLATTIARSPVEGDAGWPNAFSALPVAKDVFEKRPH